MRILLNSVSAAASLFAAVFWLMAANGLPGSWLGPPLLIENLAERVAAQVTWNACAAYSAAIAALAQACLFWFSRE
jgi:hypothetical protein